MKGHASLPLPSPLHRLLKLLLPAVLFLVTALPSPAQEHIPAWDQHFLDGGSKGVAGSFKEYEYDKNGNLIADYNKQIDITYNPLNLPQSVVWANGQRIDWVYSASGEKLQKIVKDSLGAIIYTKNYIGNFKYVDTSLEAVYFSEGRATPGEGQAFSFEYTITDHLGNGRVWWRWDEATNQPQVLQRADYYPFGLEQAQPGTVQVGVVNPYKFNGSVTGDTESKKVAGLGMEEVTDHGLNIYHAFYRTYDPVIGRMMQVDPLAEEPALISMTPYNAFLNNPILYSDPNGDNSKHIYDQQVDGSYVKREDIKNDGGVYNHTFVNVDGTNTYYNVRTGETNTVNLSEAKTQVQEYAETSDGERLGKGVQIIGDVVAGVGYSAALFTEGGSLPIAAVGEGISVLGEVIENYAKIKDEGPTTKNLIGVGIDALLEATPQFVEAGVKKTNLDELTKNIVNAQVGKVGIVLDNSVNNYVEQKSGN